MTYEEFIESFNTKFYAATSVDAIGWQEDEICNFLQSSQLQLINKLALEGNFDFLSDIVIEDTIQFGISPSFILEITAPYETKQFIDLPEDFMHFIGGSLNITKSIPFTGDSYLPLEKVSLPLAFRFIASVENKTLFSNPKIALMSEVGTRKIMLVVDAYTTAIKNLDLTYVKFPEKFDDYTSSITDVNKVLHDDIVNGAVQIAVQTMIKTQQSSQ
jgi:hypothetical protein